jgi:hypothetical protein
MMSRPLADVAVRGEKDEGRYKSKLSTLAVMGRILLRSGDRARGRMSTQREISRPARLMPPAFQHRTTFMTKPPD